MVHEDQKWARVTLRLWGSRLPLDEIGKLLGLSPTSVGRESEHIGGLPHRARYDLDYWCWEVPADSSLPLEDLVEMALDAIEPKRSEIERVLSESGGEGDLFLGYSSGNGQGAAFFSVDLLGRLGALRLPLSFDLYPPSKMAEADRR